MVQACCVLGCPSRHDVPSHCFPSNSEQLEKWKNIIPFRMDVSSLKDFKKLRICYLHFAEDDYKLGYAQRKLKDNVVPSLNLSGYSEENPSINASVHDVALNIHTQHNIMEDVHEERNDDVLTENKNISYEARRRSMNTNTHIIYTEAIKKGEKNVLRSNRTV
ncbi:uncharacterized protein LOC123988121 [Osmia bicornis bicornis]|uniref:uncharacterized protein LOC123988006 n=1 Tax=Osmia bicornis bicornis TaxID=1437191 RepID=UPI001EAED008|nr:uncharacterized protein LOC123988006 [Osmia bicornis bicornis]XP_046142608.1 uncharacterized protein LOC123988024 [Osmia bicornis bicornis]XP_046142983.1 uncharacterized protein LOC123988121 [Osmia bicornis bicornis]XP_046142984.1 uncharacterized protein LOC123988121 [Osmia bicornis bicornis]